jgi:hypothetical protein
MLAAHAPGAAGWDWGSVAMNREQQRQNAKAQKRLEGRQKQRQQALQSGPPRMTPRTNVRKATVAPSAPPKAGRSLPSWWPWVAVGAALVVIAALVYLLDPFGLRTPLPGTKLASQGNIHVNPGDTHVAYSTDPPASGPHDPIVPTRGIYTTPFYTESLPHFLEHGGVEVQYNKSTPPDAVKKLTDIVNKELDRGIGQVILAPRPDMPCEVALTAWTRITTFGANNCQPGSVGHDFNPNSAKDVNLVSDFVERNQCAYDPENQCGSGAHGATIYVTPKAGEPTVQANRGTSTPIPGTPAPAAPPTNR